MRWLAALALASSVACSESSLPTQPTPSPVIPRLVTFAGVFSDSETNTPLEGVMVCWPGGSKWSPLPSHEPNCALSGADGSYQFAANPADLPFPIQNPCPFAFRDGFEGREACVPVIGNRVSWSPTLQRRITLEAGRSVMSTIFRGEGHGGWESGGCEPCKSLHVSVPGSGTLVVRLMAEAAESGLQLEVYANGFRPDDGSLSVTTERDIQVIVKAVVAPATFELVTSFTPGS